MASEEARAQFEANKQYLDWLGLGELFTVDADGNPGGWLWQQILTGVDTAEELAIAFESTDVWRNRFSVIVEQRRRSAAGEAVEVMTPEQVVEYEYEGAQLFRRYGLPSFMYDNREDFNQYILNGLSPGELRDRIEGAYNAVANVDPEITQAFQDFYGVGRAEGALAAYFLNPDRTEEQLNREATAAYAAGIDRQFGIELRRDQAELFSLFDRQPAGIAQDLSEMNAQSLLATEGVGEANDLDTDVLFDAVVRGDAEARNLLEARAIRRASNSKATAGGAAATQEGAIGLSTAS